MRKEGKKETGPVPGSQALRDSGLGGTWDSTPVASRCQAPVARRAGAPVTGTPASLLLTTSGNPPHPMASVSSAFHVPPRFAAIRASLWSLIPWGVFSCVAVSVSGAAHSPRGESLSSDGATHQRCSGERPPGAHRLGRRPPGSDASPAAVGDSEGGVTTEGEAAAPRARSVNVGHHRGSGKGAGASCRVSSTVTR